MATIEMSVKDVMEECDGARGERTSGGMYPRRQCAERGCETCQTEVEAFDEAVAEEEEQEECEACGCECEPVVHDWGCIALCEECSVENGEPHCPRTSLSGEAEQCDWCVGYWAGIDGKECPDEEEWCEKHEQVMWKNGEKCGGCLEDEEE
jgi:hypothetical protein